MLHCLLMDEGLRGAQALPETLGGLVDQVPHEPAPHCPENVY